MTDTKPPLVNLEELMRGCKKVILQHGKRPYFLTITRRGNLILTSADDDAETLQADKQRPDQQSK